MFGGNCAVGLLALPELLAPGVAVARVLPPDPTTVHGLARAVPGLPVGGLARLTPVHGQGAHPEGGAFAALGGRPCALAVSRGAGVRAVRGANLAPVRVLPRNVHALHALAGRVAARRGVPPLPCVRAVHVAVVQGRRLRAPFPPVGDPKPALPHRADAVARLVGAPLPPALLRVARAAVALHLASVPLAVAPAVEAAVLGRPRPEGLHPLAHAAVRVALARVLPSDGLAVDGLAGVLHGGLALAPAVPPGDGHVEVPGQHGVVRNLPAVHLRRPGALAIHGGARGARALPAPVRALHHRAVGDVRAILLGRPRAHRRAGVHQVLRTLGAPVGVLAASKKPPRAPAALPTSRLVPRLPRALAVDRVAHRLRGALLPSVPRLLQHPLGATKVLGGLPGAHAVHRGAGAHDRRRTVPRALAHHELAPRHAVPGAVARGVPHRVRVLPDALALLRLAHLGLLQGLAALHHTASNHLVLLALAGRPRGPIPAPRLRHHLLARAKVDRAPVVRHLTPLRAAVRAAPLQRRARLLLARVPPRVVPARHLRPQRTLQVRHVVPDGCALLTLLGGLLLRQGDRQNTCENK